MIKSVRYVGVNGFLEITRDRKNLMQVGYRCSLLSTRINPSKSCWSLSAWLTHNRRHGHAIRRLAVDDNDDAPPELNKDWRSFRAKLIKQSQSGGMHAWSMHDDLVTY